MEKTFTFNLGNRGLLPEEAGLVDSFNKTLQQSAERNGKRLKASSLITVKIVQVGGKPVRRAASVDHDPIELPLASA